VGGDVLPARDALIPLMPGSPITAADLYRFRWVDHVRISPAGDRIAYQVGWGDQDARENRGRISILDLAGGEAFEATSGTKRDHTPEWSADGRLLFLRRKSGRDQLLVLPVGGGDAVQMTSLKDGVGSPRWSPDGTSIAFLGTVLADPEGVVDDPRPPESEETARRAPVARVARRLDYKHDGAGYVDGRYQHLHVVGSDGGEPRRLTDGAWSVEGFSWSPDGSRLVLVGDDQPDSDLRRGINVYVVEAAGGELKRVASNLMASAPAWAPKGDLVAFVAAAGDAAGLNERVWVVAADGSSEPRCLTLGLDSAVGGSVISDMRGGHGTRLVWDAAGERIYFQASRPGIAELFSVNLAGDVRTEVASDRRAIYDFDVRDGKVAFCATDPSSPGELYVYEGGAERRLGESNPWLRERYLALPERHEFTAADGWKFEGWLLRPDGEHAEGEKLPLVLEIHGGPHGEYGWAFFHEFQVLAGMGFLVFYCNPRGSDGYGEEFKKAVVRDWGGKDYLDLMSALDQLIERTGVVDESRLGVGGGSYGGFMTNWIVSHTNRFGAAVSMRSISNLVSEFAQHDIVLWGLLEMGPPPWPDPEELWRRSPIRYVNDIRTPLLLTHGEMDLRCAISQAEELFGALRLLGREVELVRFPGESHDLSRGGRPDRRVERLDRIAGWFGKYLLERQELAVTASLNTR